MKKLICLLVSVAFASASSFAQMTEGQIAFGGTNSDEVNSIVQTKDGGYAVAGYTESYGSGTESEYIADFSSTGLLKWSTVLGGTCLDQAYSILQDPRGNFVVTGYSCSFAPGTEGVSVVKLDSNGHKIWTEYIGGSKEDQGKCIINTRDGGYAIGGYSVSFGGGGPGSFYVIVLDSSGAIKWTKTIGGSADQEAYTIIQCNDGGFALAGYTLSYGAGNADVYVVKLDSVGNLKWTATAGGTLGDGGFGICETYDHGYAVTGYTSSFGAGSDDVYIVKFDSAGAMQWTKTVGGAKNDQGEAIIQTKDNGLVIAGFTASFGAGSEDVYLVKLNSSGTLLWDKTAGGVSDDVGYSVVQTSDGGFAVAGYTDSYGAGSDDVYIVKFDSLGNSCGSSEGGMGTESSGGTSSSGGSVSSGGTIADRDSGRVTTGGVIDTVCRVLLSSGINNIKSDLSDINLYPNPCTNMVNIQFPPSTINSDSYRNQLSISITDITGRVLFTDNCQLTADSYPLDVSALSPGMYFIKISSGTVSEVKKFIKE